MRRFDRRRHGAFVLLWLTIAFALGTGKVLAQIAAAQPGQQSTPPTPGGLATSQPARKGRFPVYDPATVQRGQQAFVATCGFCHGPNAKGGEGGPNLLRSEIILNDENGKQLGEFLKVGRPGQGMPKFDLPLDQVTAISTFLHERITYSANWGGLQVRNILVGDPKAGKSYFNGAGRCHQCHSPTGDLKGIGAKYEPATLQVRLVMPPRAEPGAQSRGAGEAVKPRSATVTLSSGESFTGDLLRLTDFDVTIRDASGTQRSFLCHQGEPKVTVSDPLEAHLELLLKLTDKDMHNLTAYLASLK